jgi:hypothetical protein
VAISLARIAAPPSSQSKNKTLADLYQTSLLNTKLFPSADA